ncbi:apoptosis facilitator Bcl-2-like protein 14 [Pseudorasbora parva]|uniref:apoptosis facilitator Bcl-2-like protein 14 n=1 Tax=Pseudorasbora parva TaxID=51549 RepID=UPI00351E801B
MDQGQSNGDVQIPAADSLEFRLLMAYTRKRRPTDTRLQQDIPEREPSSAEPSEKISKEKGKHRKKRLRFSFFTKCIKPKTDDTHEKQPAVLDSDSIVKVDEMESMVSELTKISDSMHFTPCEIESDSDDVVQRIAELLRVHGDELSEKIKADKALHEALQSSFKYGFFKKVMDAFCRSIATDLATEQKDQKVDVALICEATSQLYGVTYHPMNRVMGFGAKYLQEKYSKWISRNMHVGNGEVEDDEEVQ